MQSKVLRMVQLLKEFGTELRMPYSKSLGDGLFELRVILGTNITRVIYFFMVGEKAIITHGFIKKTQKTPKTEIEKAKKYKSEYIKQIYG